MSPLIKLEINQYSDLERKEIFEAGWFPEYLSPVGKLRSKELRCIELRVVGSGQNPKLPDEGYGEFLIRPARELCGDPMVHAYVIFVGSPGPKNRIKSYKGVFPYKGDIRRGSYFEREIELELNWTFIFGMAQVTEQNNSECLSLAGKFVHSFVLLSTREIDDAGMRDVSDQIMPCLDSKLRWLAIDYLKLIPEVCMNGSAIFRFGMAHNETYINLSLFFISISKKSSIQFLTALDCMRGSNCKIECEHD